MANRAWEIRDLDRDLPPELAARVRAEIGQEPTEPKGPPRPGRPSPCLIDQSQAKRIAELAAARADRHARPLGGFSWSSRADEIRLAKVPGVLGAPAMWVYRVRGRAHFGWLVSGRTITWEAQVKADDGRVLGVQFPHGRR